ncbi:hypothetical protein [Nonomuraea sp. NPDC049400]|uniref:hypothetical protein n=1 Tax=Nonomuraea sp. NPDC049400 TaxID=3364352 RepID=UPI0037BDC9A1
MMLHPMPTLDIVSAPVPLSGSAAAVAYLLATARAAGVRVSRTKLSHLLYLADLRAAEQGLPAASGLEWRWSRSGPHSFRLGEVERDLREAGVILLDESVDPFAGRREWTIHLVDVPQAVVSVEFATIMEAVLAEYGRLSPGQLYDLACQTPPMREASRQRRDDARLDLAGGPPLPDLGSGLTRLRRWAERNPLPDDEPGGVDDLAEESRYLAEHRAEAIRRLLGN